MNLVSNPEPVACEFPDLALCADFVVRRSQVPAFDPSIPFCTMDKMDQQFRMYLMEFDFFEAPESYIFHLDKDREAESLIPMTMESYHRGLKKEPQHAGRALCDSWENHGETGMIGLVQLRLRQSKASWSSWYDGSRGPDLVPPRLSQRRDRYQSQNAPVRYRKG